MFRNANLYIRPQPKDGDSVLIRAQLSFYTARVELQLICEHLELAGEGALLRAFEELKRRLASEGRSEEHTSALSSLMRISYAVFCLKNKKDTELNIQTTLHRPTQ